MNTTRENRLFLGNAGAGKNMLMNCLLVETQFKTASPTWIHPRTIQTQAADAALKQSGTYKLFFLVGLRNGRVMSDDLVTVERVLDSIDAGYLHYKFTIVLNCVDQRLYESLVARGNEFKAIKTLINRRYLTESFCFIPRIKALDERADAVVELPDEVRSFLNNEAPVLMIEEHQVRPIEVSGFAQLSQEIKK